MQKKAIRNQILVAAATASLAPMAMAATYTYSGVSGGAWNDGTNWGGTSTSPYPSVAGDVATFNKSVNTTVYLNTPVTVGVINNNSGTNELNIQNGTAGSLTFDNSGVTPAINIPNRSGGVGLLLYGTFLGSSGLTITGKDGTTQIRTNSSTNFSGLSGTLTIATGLLAPQSYTLTVPGRLALGTVGAANLQMPGRDVTVGSLSGTANAYVYNTSANICYLKLTDTTTDAIFAGTIGQTSTGTNANPIKLWNNGSGRQTITGAIVGATQVEAVSGTLAYSGATVTTTGNTTIDSGATLQVIGTNTQGTGANAGRILVLAGGNLTGAGTIRFSDTNAGYTGLSMAGVTAPGQNGIGTLTLDGANSVRAVAAFEKGGSFSMELDTGLASDQIALVNGQTNDLYFNNNVINFTDLSGGQLTTGQYTLFTSDVAGAYNGLTTSADGTITGGLSIGSGLDAYQTKNLQLLGNNIVLSVAVPEPAMISIAALSGLALMARRRRMA